MSRELLFARSPPQETQSQNGEELFHKILNLLDEVFERFTLFPETQQECLKSIDLTLSISYF